MEWMSRSESFWPKVQDGAREGHLSPTEATATQQEQNHEMLAKCMFVESWAEPWQLPHVCCGGPCPVRCKGRSDMLAKEKGQFVDLYAVEEALEWIQPTNGQRRDRCDIEVMSKASFPWNHTIPQ